MDVLRLFFGCSMDALTLESGVTPGGGIYSAGSQVAAGPVHSWIASAGRGVRWRVWMLWGCAARGTCVQGAKIAHLDGASAWRPARSARIGDRVGSRVRVASLERFFLLQYAYSQRWVDERVVDLPNGV